MAPSLATGACSTPGCSCFSTRSGRWWWSGGDVMLGDEPSRWGLMVVGAASTASKMARGSRGPGTSCE